MHLVFDFDGTITQADTIAELATGAIALHRARRGSGAGARLRAAWDAAVRDYLADGDGDGDAPDGDAPDGDDGDAVEREVRRLAAARPVEEASLDRVGRAGLFAELGADDLFGLGAAAVRAGRVVLRPGFGTVVAAARRRAWPTAVVSVHWSRAFIRGALHPLRPTAVLANDVAADGRVRGASGRAPITTAPDKRAALRRLVAPGRPVVFFGDAPADLACLVDASRSGGAGVVMAPAADSPLTLTLRRLGLAVLHVADLQPAANTEPRLCWARDFREVLDSGLLEP